MQQCFNETKKNEVKEMNKEKTYRVKNHIWKEVCERNIEYIAKKGEMVAEVKMLNAIISIGLEQANDEKIEAYLKLNDEIE